MKKFAENMTKYLSVTAMTAVLTLLTIAQSDARTAKPEDEMKLNNNVALLNYDAKIPDGDRIATDQLAKSFSVSNDKIAALRTKDLDYGEIAAVLAMADKMPGGSSDANISKILSSRSTAAGWPQVASSLDVDLGKVAGKVDKVEDNVHKEIKSSSAGGYAGRGAGGTSGTPTTSSERDVGTGGSDF